MQPVRFKMQTYKTWLKPMVIIFGMVLLALYTVAIFIIHDNTYTIFLTIIGAIICFNYVVKYLKWYRRRDKLYLELSMEGVRDTRLFDEIIEWEHIRGARMRDKQESENLEEHIELAVSHRYLKFPITERLNLLFNGKNDQGFMIARIFTGDVSSNIREIYTILEEFQKLQQQSIANT